MFDLLVYFFDLVVRRLEKLVENIQFLRKFPDLKIVYGFFGFEGLQLVFNTEGLVGKDHEIVGVDVVLGVEVFEELNDEGLVYFGFELFGELSDDLLLLEKVFVNAYELLGETVFVDVQLYKFGHSVTLGHFHNINNKIIIKCCNSEQSK